MVAAHDFRPEIYSSPWRYNPEKQALKPKPKNTCLLDSALKCQSANSKPGKSLKKKTKV